jgi:RNA polymerase sigma-70 factor (ECF subfamily)
MQNADPLWLVSQCIAGNEDAIESLFHQYEMGVFKLALSIVDDPAEASEITHETFDAVLHALPKYKEKQSFRAWLYAIAINRSRSHLRKRKTLQRLQATLTNIFRIEFEKQKLPEDTVIQNEKEAALWRSINQLEEIYRIVVVLRYFQELSVREISEILAVPEGTIHSRLHYARDILRATLESLNGE